jgi:hypothetical protein
MNRETITATLFGRLSQIPGLKTTSRRVKSFDEVSPAQMPALYVAIGPSTSQAQNNRPPVWSLGFTVYLYVHDSSPSGPSSTLNSLLGSIEAALKVQPAELATTTGYPGAANGTSTLGGLVSHIGISEVQTDEGSLGDLGVAILSLNATCLG